MAEEKEKNSILSRRKFIESQVDLSEMIVIDNGTDTIKIGRSGSDYPAIIIPNIAGLPKTISENDAAPPKRIYFGKDLSGLLEQRKYNVEFVRPIKESRIADVDDMVDLWDYALRDLLEEEPAKTSILLVDSPLNSKEYRAKLVETLFEKVKVSQVMVMNSAALSLFSVGATVGLVTEIGHGTAYCGPVYEGFLLPHALERSKAAGEEITKKLEELLKHHNVALKGKDTLEHSLLVQRLKEQKLKVATDFAAEMRAQDNGRTERSESKHGEKGRVREEQLFELPDGNVVELARDILLQPGEVLFEGNASILSLIQVSLERCDEDLQAEVAKKMIMCGGCSMLRGLESRMQREIGRVVPGGRMEFDWQRKYAAWIGGSMVGSLSTFKELAIDNSELSHAEILKRIF